MPKLSLFLLIVLTSLVSFAQTPLNVNTLNVKTIVSTGTLAIVSGNSNASVTINGVLVSTGIPYVAFTTVSNIAVTGSNLAYTTSTSALPKVGGRMSGDINFTNSGLTSVDFTEFDLAPTGATSIGKIQWYPNRSTFRYGLTATVNQEVGQQLMLYARNEETNQINKGEVVYLAGANGDNPAIKRASNASELTSSTTIGIAAENIAVNASGFIVTRGTVYNVNTEGLNEQDHLYLGSHGNLQTNLPVAPLHGVMVGVVERVHQNVGQIYVFAKNYNELEELSDIYVKSPTNGNVLTWIAASNRWEARNASSIITDGTGITNVNATTLGGYTPGSFVTVAGWNSWSTNVAKQVAVPASNSASGAVGYYAADSSNLFIFVQNALGFGTDRWLRITGGSVTW